MLEFLCTNRTIKAVTVEVSLDTEQEVAVTVEDSNLATILDTTVPLSTVKKPVSITEVSTDYLEFIKNINVLLFFFYI